MPKIEWNGDALAAAAKAFAQEEAERTAEIIKGKAVDLCPLESSQTRNSGAVAKVENGAEISFSTPQAVWLHESHGYKPSHAGTGPGYLRIPLLAEEEAYQNAIAEGLAALFG